MCLATSATCSCTAASLAFFEGRAFFFEIGFSMAQAIAGHLARVSGPQPPTNSQPRQREGQVTRGGFGNLAVEKPLLPPTLSASPEQVIADKKIVRTKKKFSVFCHLSQKKL